MGHRFQIGDQVVQLRAHGTRDDVVHAHRNGREEDLSRATDIPLGDGVPNMVKYALGLSAWTQGTGSHVEMGSITISNHSYLSATYKRPEPAPSGIGYLVEMTSDLQGSGWTTNGTVVEVGELNNNLRTVCGRDLSPIGMTNARFLQFKVRGP